MLQSLMLVAAVRRRARVRLLLVLITLPLALLCVRETVLTVSLTLAGRDAVLPCVTNGRDEWLAATRGTTPPPPPHAATDTAAAMPRTLPVHVVWRTHDAAEYAAHSRVSADFLPSHVYWQDTPGVNVTVWDDADVRALLDAQSPQLRAYFDALREPVSRADVARIAIVAAVGGAYSDLDAYPVGDRLPASWLLATCMSGEYDAVLVRGHNTVVSNHFFCAPRGGRVMSHVLRELVERRAVPRRRFLVPFVNTLAEAGPMFFAAAIADVVATRGGGGAPLRFMCLDVQNSTFVLHFGGRSWQHADGDFIALLGDRHGVLGAVALGSALLLAAVLVVRRLRISGAALYAAVLCFVYMIASYSLML